MISNKKENDFLQKKKKGYHNIKEALMPNKILIIINKAIIDLHSVLTV